MAKSQPRPVVQKVFLRRGVLNGYADAVVARPAPNLERSQLVATQPNHPLRTRAGAREYVPRFRARRDLIANSSRKTCYNLPKICSRFVEEPQNWISIRDC